MNKKENPRYKNHYSKNKKIHNQPYKHKIVYKKQIEKSHELILFEKFQNDLGNDYSLNDIIEIGYPIIETQIEVIVSGKPSDILQELHILLLDLISNGLDKKPDLANFLGVNINDFVLDELYSLLENGLITLTEDGKYVISIKGAQFIAENKFIPITTPETYTFFTDPFSRRIANCYELSLTNTDNRLKPPIKIDFQFIQDNWIYINKSFVKFTLGEKEIIDLGNYKRSIIYSNPKYQKVFALIYYPKIQSGKKIQIKAYNSDNKYLKDESLVLNNLYSSDKFIFDFNQELKSTQDYKDQFSAISTEIQLDKKRTGSYKDISTFEHKELIKEALLTAEFAVYIESPWIRRATMDYIDAMKFFLSKKNTKLFIAHGIDSKTKNDPHKETFEEILKLRDNNKERVYLWHLPSHFQAISPNRNGSHRKILIKDYDYYIKGSFNWLSYNANEDDNYAVEEGTQFFDNVKDFWINVFSDYSFDCTLIDW